MTESLAGIRVPAIGALELKRAYQLNLAFGLLLAAGLHLAVIGGLWVYVGKEIVPPPVVPTAEPDPGRVFVLPDVTIVPDELPEVVRGYVPQPKTGIPTPVPDVLVEREALISTRAQLHRYVPGGRTGVAGEPTGRDEGIVRDTFPAMGAYVFGVRDPVPILTVIPVYPAMAERVGLTGDLMVRVLVDAHGRVQDAVIISCSTPGVGFEESVRDALLQWVFTPAVQNDHPVAAWFNVPVSFATE